MKIPFNKPYMTGREIDYISQAHARGHLSGDGFFTGQCHEWLQKNTGCDCALLTHSCTAALEMAAILAGIQPGDEVIMPSYTFVSTANAFVLRGGVPVFVDIRRDTLNIDETRIAKAVTPRTKAIVPVHYAGVSCEMDAIMEVARNSKLTVIEDAAQGIMSSYRDKPVGKIGHLAALSFHETKNISCGEGGAILINDMRYVDRARCIREKGTNRAMFFEGKVDKYSWVDVGSSYLPSELSAAFLLAQMEKATEITKRRLDIWSAYHSALAELESAGYLRRPTVPSHVQHNAHMYYILLPTFEKRRLLIEHLKSCGIYPVTHYVPLHDSTAGKKYCRVSSDMSVTNDISSRLLRLPLWIGMSEYVEEIAEEIGKFLVQNQK